MPAPVAEPYRIRVRLLARLRAWTLDQVLASGACSEASAVLSLRARRLIGIATRHALARELRDVIRIAHDPRHPFDLELGLRRVGRRRPCRLLLRDGGRPLYNELLADRLERSVYAAIDALQLRLSESG